MKILLTLLLVPAVPGVPPSPPQMTRWELVQSRTRDKHCLDTTRTKTWREADALATLFLRREGLRKQVLEEANGHVREYDVAPTGRTREVAAGTGGRQSFKLQDAHSGEAYEEHVLYRSDQWLVVCLRPDHLDIYRNTQFPADSLPARRIHACFRRAAAVFGQPLPACP